MKAVAALLMMLVATSAHANLNIYDFQHINRNDPRAWNEVRVYLMGVGEGIETANNGFSLDKKVPEFCIPDAIAFNGDNFIQILDDYLKTHPPAISAKEMSAAIMLWFAIKEAFPCK